MHPQGYPQHRVSPHQELQGPKIPPAFEAERRGVIVKIVIETITRIDGTVTTGMPEILETSTPMPGPRKRPGSENGTGRRGEGLVMHVVLRVTDMAAALIAIGRAIGLSVTNAETGQTQEDLVKTLRGLTRLHLVAIELLLKDPEQQPLQVLRLSRMLLLQLIRGVVSTGMSPRQHQPQRRHMMCKMTVILEVADVQTAESRQVVLLCATRHQAPRPFLLVQI